MSARVEVVYFPKCCACCGVPLFHVKKMRMSWYECRTETCLVNMLDRQEQEEAERIYLERLEARRKRREGK